MLMESVWSVASGKLVRSNPSRWKVLPQSAIANEDMPAAPDRTDIRDRLDMAIQFARSCTAGRNPTHAAVT